MKEAKNRFGFWLRRWPGPNAAVAELVSRGKEQIVIIRPYRDGLVLHGMFYKNEVKDVGQIPRAESERGTQDEVNLATGSIDRMSNDQFVPEEYHDEYRLRVLAMIDAKLKGVKSARRHNMHTSRDLLSI